MPNDASKASKPSILGQPKFAKDSIATTPQDRVSGSNSPPKRRVVDSVTSASLLAFTGGSLDAFLYLNHDHIFAGVMTGNAVLCGIAVFNRSQGGAMHYIRPLLAYVCGILLIAVFQHKLRHHSVRFALASVAVGLFALSLLPHNFPENTYVFMVVLLTGFLVGIARRVDTYSYNATVLTGSLRDATMSLYHALNPATRAENLREARALWFVMISLIAGAAAGGLLGKHIGNHALWLPVGVVCLVLARVVLRAGR